MEISDGNMQRYKARLVPQGYSQESGMNYHEVFAPVAKYNSIHIVLTITNELDLEIDQMDAFLNGDLEEDIYMQQPDSFIDKDHPKVVCRLQKSLYVLKQAAHYWNKTIGEFSKNSGYLQSDAEPCIY